MAAPDFLSRDVDPVESYFLHRRNVEVRRRRKRQAPPVSAPESESEDSDSDSEDESSSRARTRTGVASSTAPPLASITSASSSGLRSGTTLAFPLITSTTFATSMTSTARRQITSIPVPTGPIAEEELAPTETPRTKTRAHQSLSHGATIALEVIGIMVGICFLLGICFFFYRRWKRRQHPSPNADTNNNTNGTPPNEKISYGNFFSSAKSQWGGWSSIWGGNQSSAPSSKHTDPNEAARQERMGRVRTSLLGEKELRGGLMDIGNGSGTPMKKAVLKKEGDGRMVMNRTGGVTGDGRLEIEAGGVWDDPITIARGDLSDRAAGNGILPVVPAQTRATNNANSNTNPAANQPPKEHLDTALGKTYLQSRAAQARNNPRYSLTTISKELSQEEDVNIRGSIYASEKSWKGRARERESKISLAKWRDPVSWVKDQVERKKDGRPMAGGLGGMVGSERGMERLPD